MSQSNGVIRIGNKGLKWFAIGDEGSPGGEPFELDVVVAVQQWFNTHDQFFEGAEENEEGKKVMPSAEIPRYNQAQVDFTEELRLTNPKNCAARDDPASKYRPATVSEARDFIARLREQYDSLVVFFRPRSPEEQDSPDSSGVELRFSEEGKEQS